MALARQNQYRKTSDEIPGAGERDGARQRANGCKYAETHEYLPKPRQHPQRLRCKLPEHRREQHTRDAGGKDAKLAEWRQKHRSEVEKVGNLIGEIDELEPEDDKWLTKVKNVHEGVLNHIQEEEGDIFPRISKLWDEARLTQAGKKMQEMKSKKADAA